MKTILMAEDSAEDALLLRRLVKRVGLNARLEIVPDGVEALAYLKGEGEYADRERFPFPDLTLLDIKMPRKTGLEVLAEVRDDPRFTKLLVVFLTSSDELSDINQAFSLHANSYVTKTANLHSQEQLIRKLEEYWLLLNKCPTCE